MALTLLNNTHPKLVLYQANQNSGSYVYYETTVTPPTITNISDSGTLTFYFKPTAFSDNTGVASFPLVHLFLPTVGSAIRFTVPNYTGQSASEFPVFEYYTGNDSITPYSSLSASFTYFSTGGAITSIAGAGYGVNLLSNNVPTSIPWLLFASSTPSDISSRTIISGLVSSLTTTIGGISGKRTLTAISSNDSGANNYIVFKSIDTDIAVVNPTTCVFSKTGNIFSLTQAGNTYTFDSINNFYYLNIWVGQTLTTNSPSAVSTSTTSDITATKHMSNVVYWTNSQLIKKLIIATSPTIIGTNSTTLTVSFANESTVRFLPVPTQVTVKLNVTYTLVTASYNSVVITDVSLNNTPELTAAGGVGTYGSNYILKINTNGLPDTLKAVTPASNGLITLSNVANFVRGPSGSQTCIHVPGFNATSFTGLGNVPNPPAYTNSSINTTPIISRPLTADGGKYPSLALVYDIISTTEPPTFASFGLVLNNYPYGSKFVSKSFVNRSINYNWIAINSADYLSAQYQITPSAGGSPYSIIITPTNTTSNKWSAASGAASHLLIPALTRESGGAYVINVDAFSANNITDITVVNLLTTNTPVYLVSTDGEKYSKTAAGTQITFPTDSTVTASVSTPASPADTTVNYQTKTRLFARNIYTTNTGDSNTDSVWALVNAPI